MATTTPASSAPTSWLDQIDQTTLVSLFAVLMLLSAAQRLGSSVLHPQTPGSLRVLFVWFVFDFLIHIIFEGSFLYNCFFAHAPLTPALASSTPAVLLNNFLADPAHLYGSLHADNWASRLWLVYAKADQRWAGADLTIISLELLTVFIGGPLSAWCAYAIWKRDWRVNFWMVVLGTGEIYGGWMTFAPEWLSGSGNLETGNWLFKWVFLWGFNGLWVLMPLYSLVVAWRDFGRAFEVRNEVARAFVEREKGKGRGKVE